MKVENSGYLGIKRLELCTWHRERRTEDRRTWWESSAPWQKGKMALKFCRHAQVDRKLFDYKKNRRPLYQ